MGYMQWGIGWDGIHVSMIGYGTGVWDVMICVDRVGWDDIGIGTIGMDGVGYTIYGMGWHNIQDSGAM